jgi:hypothetical protein
VSCNCEYGICDQTANCPVRATPVHILEFKPRQTEEAPTDADAEADSPEPLYARIGFWMGVMAAVTFIWSACLAWVAYEILTGPTVATVQAWIDGAAQWLVSVIPMTPFF